MIQPVECQTAAEVRANYKAVRARWRRLDPPAPVMRRPPPPPKPVVAEPAPAPKPKRLPPPYPISVWAIPPHKWPSMNDILRAVSLRFGISIEDIKNGRRLKHIMLPRQLAYWLARKHLGTSQAVTGMLVGGKHHTTVRSGYMRIERLRRFDPAVDQHIRELEAALRLSYCGDDT